MQDAARKLNPPTSVHEGNDVGAQLGRLGRGLTVAVLLEAVEAGEIVRTDTTDNDVASKGGTRAYHERVKMLRDQLVPHGWTVVRREQIELTQSPCQRVVIRTWPGDAGVGIRNAFPKPIRQAGDGTKRALQAASSLPLDANWLNAPVSTQTGVSWYLLLVHRVLNVVRSELSLPTGYSEDGDVLGWDTRILLPELVLPGEKRDSTPPEPYTTDVPVTRKR